MPSGYEKSPDYGGPDPWFGGWFSVAVGILALAALAAVTLWATGAFGADLAPLAPTPRSWDQAKRLSTQIYEGREITLYCGCEYEPQGTGGVIDHDSCGYDGPATHSARAGRLEWEHIVPASTLRGDHPVWQAGGRGACESDLECGAALFDPHNLAPSVGQVNAIRSNKPYDELDESDHTFGECTVKSTSAAFEPPECIRGDVARVYLYMESTHDLELSEAEGLMYEAWAAGDPVSPWEAQRDERIAEHFGASNPLVAGSIVDAAGECAWE